MANPLISDFNLPVKGDAPDTHVMRACQTILSQVRLVADDSNDLIFDNRVEIVKWVQSSVFRADAPYALLSIMPNASQMLTGEGTTVWSKTPLQLALIFSAVDGADEGAVQTWGSALSRRVWDYLDPVLSDNPHGIDFRNEIGTNGAEIWQWDGESKRKETLDRKVSQAPNVSKSLSGSRWRYLLEFTIRTWPNTPL